MSLSVTPRRDRPLGSVQDRRGNEGDGDSWSRPSVPTAATWPSSPRRRIWWPAIPTGAPTSICTTARADSLPAPATDANGAQGNDGSFQPCVNGDGPIVAFESLADNLVTRDSNLCQDIYVISHGKLARLRLLPRLRPLRHRYRLSKAVFPGTLPADSGLVLAPGETFPEALCGAPLAAAYGGPVLLTYKNALANNVKAEMLRLAPKYVFCIGLTATAVNPGHGRHAVPR